MVICGIDYSMTSPAICIHTGDSWSLNNCAFYYQTSVKKLEFQNAMFQGVPFKDYVAQEERFFNNALWAEAIIQKHAPNFAALEGYAMGAKGKVFHIGENTGMLKHIMWRNKLDFIVPPPTVIKKFATGKGNANKEKMEEAFLAETSFNIRTVLAQSELSFNPSSDLIDAYYMCKYAFMETVNGTKEKSNKRG